MSRSVRVLQGAEPAHHARQETTMSLGQGLVPTRRGDSLRPPAVWSAQQEVTGEVKIATELQASKSPKVRNCEAFERQNRGKGALWSVFLGSPKFYPEMESQSE